MNQDLLFIEKYQPRTLEDFNLDQIPYDLIKTFLNEDRLFLIFHGNNSCGKTTLLNIIVNEYYNGYDKDLFNKNILYINNLKEQGINYYRSEVKSFCQTKSVISAKKKIIIIDDIDQINEQSQQVFRNFIDTFSSKIHLLASCQNIQKVTESLQSRTFIIYLNAISPEQIKAVAKQIMLNEGIIMTDEAFHFLLDTCKNINYLKNSLEKTFLLKSKSINLELIKQLVFNINYDDFDTYMIFLQKKQLKEATAFIYNFFDSGYSVIDILDLLFNYIKLSQILNENDKYKIIPILCKYIEIFHNIHEDEIELALITNDLLKLFHPV